MQKLVKNAGTKEFLKVVRSFTLLVFTTLLSVTVLANTYVPNTFADPAITTLNNATGQINGGATISLRSALMAADNSGGSHTITLSTGTYVLDGAGSYTVPSQGSFSSRTIFFGNSSQDITINGNGPANTIINMAAAGRDRIFAINYDGSTADVSTTINGVKFTNGYLNYDTYGGAAIYAGPYGTVETLTISNCAFDNNICPSVGGGGGLGGAIYMFQGTLNIDNTAFTNNKSIDGDGGAIIYLLFNQGDNGVINITNSTFTGNTAGTRGGAISFISQSFIVAQSFAVNINSNTFLSNTATGFGGAISADNALATSVSLVNYNRFVGNTSTASAASGALYFVESAGSVNAENNWWGCNTGPTASPCNRAGGDIAGGGTLDVSPWLQLKATASPTEICNSAASIPGNTATVTAGFLSNSDGNAIAAANLSRLIGLPVTWTSTLGSTGAPEQLQIQSSGEATTTFTSNGTSGTATVNAQVDNVPASETSPARASITVSTSSTAPTGATGATNICPGSNTTLTVSGGAKGAGAITEWFTGSCGTTPAGTGDAITVSPAVTTTYYVRYRGSCNSTDCATITVTVNTLSTAPTGATGITTICPGSSTTLTVDGGTKGTGAITEWFTGACGGTAAGTGDAITVSPTVTTTYYVRYSGSCNSTGCATVTVTVNTASTAPTGATGTTTICPGNSTTLTVDGGSKGTAAITEWFTGSCGGTPAGTGDAITVSPAASTTYYVRYSGTCNNTSCATVTVTVNTLSTAPTGATGITTICPGNSTTLTVEGGTKGTGAITEWFTGSCDGTPAGTGDAITVSPTVATTYYVRYNGTCNTSACATVTVTVNSVSTAPTGATGTTTICNGSSTTLTVDGGSKGTGAITEWFTGACGSTSAGTGDAITVSPAVTTTYYVRYNGTCNATGCAAVTVTVNQFPTINTPTVIQPTCTTLTGTITVNATGSGTLEYQLNGGTFQASPVFSGLAPGNYNIAVRSQTAPDCVSAYAGNPIVLSAATGCCTEVNSGTVASGDQTICNGGDPSNITFSTAPSGGAPGGSFDYQWYYKDGINACPSGTNTSGWTLISGATGNSYDPPSGLTVSRTYAVTVDPTGTTDCGPATWANGCRKVTVSPVLVATCSNNNPTLYFGYAGDQTATIKAKATGGVGPYTISITMNRPLNCNVITSTGDELWTASGGTSVNNVCPASGPGLLPPVSTVTGIASGVDYSVNVTLMQDAIFTATITDANGCVTTCTTTINAEDVRCFAGNSGNEKVSICHQTGSGCVSICVSQNAVAAHLAHGDFVGNCNSGCEAPNNLTTKEDAVENTPATATENSKQAITEKKLETPGVFGVKALTNPTDNQFSLVVAGGSNEKIFVTVYNALGRIVKEIEKRDGRVIIFGEELMAGYYMAVVRQGNNTKTIKLIKQ